MLCVMLRKDHVMGHAKLIKMCAKDALEGGMGCDFAIFGARPKVTAYYSARYF